MIAFGSCITEVEPYRRYAEPGIRFAGESDSERFAFSAVGSIGRSYNLLLDAAAAREDLEAFVIAHPHAEIADPELCTKIRRALRDPDVAVVGCIGASNVRGIAWWEGSVVSGPVVHRYGEHGGGELPAYAWTRPSPAPAEVETVDGFLLVLSPWAVRNLRFDESLTLGHGFDLDFCLQVREAGRKVMVEDLRIIHHHALELVGDPDLWVAAHMQLAEKWHGQLTEAPADEDAARRRGRRAEGEREAARAIAYSNALVTDARILEFERLLEETTSTVSWRITEPLRRANQWRRVAAERRNGHPQ